jgi:hypothetical protein
MKKLFTIVCLLFIATLASCDVRSDTAKRDMEKFISSPTPPITPFPTMTPVDPKDVVEVDTSQQGDTIHFNGEGQKKTESCTKFNRLMVNGDKYVLTIKGVCRQIMINGDGNDITADAAMEFVLNGSNNTVRYSRYANGKQPTIVESRTGNTIEKVPASTMTSGKPARKHAK